MKLKFTKSKPKDAKIALVSFQDTKESHVRIGAKGRKEITIGIGPKGEYNRRKLILAARKIISLAKSNKVKALTIHWKDLESQAKDAKVSREDAAELITTNLEMANFSFVAFKTKPKEGWDFVRNVAIYGDISEKEKKALEKGQMIGEEVVYEVQILNRGSKTAEQIKLVTQFSDHIEPIRVAGGAAEIVPGQALFRPLQQLQPGQQVTLKIFAKASAAGSHRFRAELTSQDPETKLVQEEMTRFMKEPTDSTVETAAEENADN